MPCLCYFYPGICLTTEEKARKNLNQGRKKPQSEASRKCHAVSHVCELITLVI